ncbi:MAG TPA: MBOAT family protein [Planctomycetota bacterium]|nr:MBOAT family protein [Planctomycetota bacterium]
MVFSSHLFFFYFLPLALLVYHVLPRRGKHLALTLLSYVFYGWANPLFVVLMLASTLIDYLCGLVISQQIGHWSDPVKQLEVGGSRTRHQKVALVASICSNLALLGFFKYFNFATGNYNDVVKMLGLPGLSLDLAFKVTLPLGISFYTFQSMSYSIDVYRGHARAIRNFIDFACYVSMFPQLVAGPIIRFQEVADQLEHRDYTLEKFARGAAFISVGLAKKVLLANSVGKIADVAFDAGSVGFADAWFGAIAYAFQIYYDFSAYSDMAIGLGLMLGFVFPKNFDSPYRSESITEFWRRWHISLSTWLRDYLYIPLGGNRKGPARTYVNLAVVMLLGGLWHGAAWNFVIWGGLHGAMLAFERAMGKRSFYRFLPRPARIALTFIIVLFGWVFFRAADLPSALHYCGAMIGLGHPGDAAALLGGIIYKPWYLGCFVAAAAIAWGFPQTWDWTRRLSVPKAAAIAAMLWISLIVLTTQEYNPFIYFIF